MKSPGPAIHRSPALRALLAGVATLLLATPALAQDGEGSVYKWVDAQGIPHYADQPPPGVTAQETLIRYRKTDVGIVQARAKAKAEADAAAAVREGQAAEDAAGAAEEKQQNLSEREKGCELAKGRMAKYEEARRLYRPGPNGERIYLTDEELDAERANARRAVGDWCGAE